MSRDLPQVGEEVLISFESVELDSFREEQKREVTVSDHWKDKGFICDNGDILFVCGGCVYESDCEKDDLRSLIGREGSWRKLNEEIEAE